MTSDARKQSFEEEAENLRESKINFKEVSVGAMIEVPSAVFMANKIAQVVDFFELGTNDLVQYTLAVDRGNDEVADWFRTLHPAVLHSIDQSLKAGRQAGIPVIVCGEMASTPGLCRAAGRPRRHGSEHDAVFHSSCPSRHRGHRCRNREAHCGGLP